MGGYIRPRGEASAVLVWDVASRKLLREIPFDAEFGAYSLLLNADGTPRISRKTLEDRYAPWADLAKKGIEVVRGRARFAA